MKDQLLDIGYKLAAFGASIANNTGVDVLRVVEPGKDITYKGREQLGLRGATRVALMFFLPSASDLRDVRRPVTVKRALIFASDLPK